MVKLQEIVYKVNPRFECSLIKVLGYRLYIGNNKYDFSADLLDYIYQNYLKHGINYDLITKPILFTLNSEGVYSEGTNDNAIELSNEMEIDYHLCKYLSKCNTNLESIESVLYYRYLFCRRLLLECEIYLGDIEKVAINSRFTTLWGRCGRRKTGIEYGIPIYSYSIEISEALLVATSDYEGIDNTIIHEILHTCKGCFNHGARWKAVAERICYECGFDIKRLSSAEEKGFDANVLINQGYYACQCTSCGHIVTHKTECQFIKHPEWYTCSCGGKFTRIN